MIRLLPLSLALSTFAIAAADPQTLERGKQAEQRSCIQCHSLRLVDSQRLSAAAWGKEIDKMIGWGAVVPDRQLLLDYLSEEFSDTKPVPRPVLSGDGSKSQNTATGKK
jgi:mono/diheme cytochrome c family protein